MIKHHITNSNNPDFLELVRSLDSDLHDINGEEQGEYDKHNVLEYIDSVILLYQNDSPIACGAFKEYDKTTVEMKRVYVTPKSRGLGISKELIMLLEKEAISRSYTRIILETGKEQIVAIALYESCKYLVMENYPPYNGLKNSVCMGKELI